MFYRGLKVQALNRLRYIFGDCSLALTRGKLGAIIRIKLQNLSSIYKCQHQMGRVWAKSIFMYLFQREINI
jgi:hypothetical protein